MVNFDTCREAIAAEPSPQEADSHFNAGENLISVSIAIPWSFERRREITRPWRLHVVLTNTSNQPQNIWKEWNSWGYYALSFEVTDEHGKTSIVRKGIKVWTVDGTDYWTLDPHESLVIDVDCASDEWEGFPRPTKEPQSVAMRAIFEIKPDAASRKFSVWTGRVFSKVADYTFYK